MIPERDLLKKRLAKQLNPKQKIYCLEYLKDLSQTEAYERAGYKSKSRQALRANASRLMQNPKINIFIQILMEERAESLNITVKEVLHQIYKVAMTPMQEIVTWEVIETWEEYDGKKLPVYKRILKLRDPGEVNGTLLRKIKEGAHGLEVELEPRAPYMQMLFNHVGGAKTDPAASAGNNEPTLVVVPMINENCPLPERYTDWEQEDETNLLPEPKTKLRKVTKKKKPAKKKKLKHAS